ncbi:hypothetical protein K438DRAFT_1781125 [Mycena galopus ATCC 62051]|nr:hypothetical protein K438DRAFT_1781125 [Mycena galopus ATCC 62051]
MGQWDIPGTILNLHGTSQAKTAQLTTLKNLALWGSGQGSLRWTQPTTFHGPAVRGRVALDDNLSSAISIPFPPSTCSWWWHNPCYAIYAIQFDNSSRALSLGVDVSDIRSGCAWYAAQITSGVANHATMARGLGLKVSRAVRMSAARNIDRPHWVPKKAIQVHYGAVTLYIRSAITRGSIRSSVAGQRIWQRLRVEIK